MSSYNPLLLTEKPFPRQTSSLLWGGILSIWLHDAEKRGFSSRHFLHVEGTVSDKWKLNEDRLATNT